MSDINLNQIAASADKEISSASVAVKNSFKEVGPAFQDFGMTMSSAFSGIAGSTVKIGAAGIALIASMSLGAGIMVGAVVLGLIVLGAIAKYKIKTVRDGNDLSERSEESEKNAQNQQVTKDVHVEELNNQRSQENNVAAEVRSR